MALRALRLGMLCLGLGGTLSADPSELPILSGLLPSHAWVFVGAVALIVGGLLGLLWKIKRLLRRQMALQAAIEARTQDLQTEIAERTKIQAALGVQQTHLEQVVADRTAELRAANENLARESAERMHSDVALRRSEDRYRRFFEDVLAGAFMAKPDGQLLDCNPAFAKIIGLERLGDASTLHLRTLLQDRKTLEQLLVRLQRDGKILGCEFKMERTNGRPVSILANLVGQFDAEHRLIEINGYILDTTEQKDLEEQLRHSQKMEAIGQLAGGVAHDFNNLLTAILGCSDLLLEQPGITDRIRGLANEIHDASARAASLTRQLLAFSRRQELKPQLMDLGCVIAPMEKMLRRLIGEHIELTMNLAAGEAKVKADPAQMEQVLLNLVVNARDAMPKGGKLAIESAAVTVSESYARRHLELEPGRYVRLSVRDTGGGITPEILPLIFEPFFTTKGSGKGTGLGLSTVYGIVRQSNGIVLAESKVGEGTAFHIYLPEVKSEASEGASIKAVPNGLAQGRETILLTEDDAQVRALARKSLELGGYRVMEAENGDHAVALVQAEAGVIDMLLTDVVMPGMNGRELAERLKALRPDLRVLFMSGYTDDVLSGLGQTLGPVELLDKPFTPKALLQRVRSVLDA